MSTQKTAQASPKVNTLELGKLRNALRREKPQDKYWSLINKSNSKSVTDRNVGLRSNTKNLNPSSSRVPRFYT